MCMYSTCGRNEAYASVNGRTPHCTKFAGSKASLRCTDHAREFETAVLLDGVEWGRGEGRTKKEAEQVAAAAALQRLVDEGKLTDEHG